MANESKSNYKHKSTESNSSTSNSKDIEDGNDVNINSKLGDLTSLSNDEPADIFKEIDTQNIRNNELQRVDTYRSFAGAFSPGDELRKIPSKKSTAGYESKGVDIKNMPWDSPSDPGNPYNWPNSKKWAVTFTVAFLCLVVTVGSSLYVSGTAHIMYEMDASQELVLSGLTFYLLGLCLGPALGAPISELFGRKVVYISSLPLSMAFTVGIAKAKNIETILVLRFFNGLFGSPALAIVGGTITDLWNIDMIGVALSLFSFAPFAGPVLGPIIGGFVAERKGWRWTIWVQLMFMGVSLPFIIMAPETYKVAIMKKRAETRNLKIKKPDMTNGEMIKSLISIVLTRPLIMLITEPIVMVLSIYTAFIFSILFGFFEAYPIIFRGVYGMSLGVSGLPFLGIGIGLVIGVAVYIYIDRTMFYPKNPDGTRGKRDEAGNIIPKIPEEMLLPCKIGSVILAPSLFWNGWSARTSVHWIVPTLAGIPFGTALILIFFTAMTYFAASYPPISTASALAANNLLRYIVACVFPLFTVQMYNKLGIDWASSLFGFVALALLPVPWFFEKYGAKLRARSRYGYAALEKKQEEESTTD